MLEPEEKNYRSALELLDTTTRKLQKLRFDAEQKFPIRVVVDNQDAILGNVVYSSALAKFVGVYLTGATVVGRFDIVQATAMSKT